MVRIKATPRRSRRLWVRNHKRKKFIIKERLEKPKTVAFNGKLFVVRYRRVGKKKVKR